MSLAVRSARVGARAATWGARAATLKELSHLDQVGQIKIILRKEGAEVTGE